MRKAVISTEISPKFDRVQTTDTLPVSQLTENIIYQTYITTFLVLSKAAIQIHAIARLRISGSIDPRALPDTTTFWAIETRDLIIWRFKLLSYYDSTDLFTPLLSV